MLVDRRDLQRVTSSQAQSLYNSAHTWPRECAEEGAGLQQLLALAGYDRRAREMKFEVSRNDKLLGRKFTRAVFARWSEETLRRRFLDGMSSTSGTDVWT